MTLTPPNTVSIAVISPKYWLGPYAIAVSTLYLWGYWGSFQINVLEYISISDIVKGTIYPLGSAFAFLALGVILGEVLSPDIQPGGGADTAVGKFLNKWATLLFLSFLLSLVLLAVLGPVRKWQVLPYLFALAIYIPLKSSDFLRAELKSDGARSVSIYLLTALIPFAYGRGAIEADGILTGTNYSYPTTAIPYAPSSAGASPSVRIRYIGKAGDRYVFFDPVSKSSSFVAASSLTNLTLARHTAGSMTIPAPVESK
jgi:hypothetical protein